MIHYVNNIKGTFYYDHNTKKFGVVTNRNVVKETFQDIVDMDEFIGRDLNVHIISKEPVLFLVDFVSRVFGATSNLQKSESIPA